MPRWKFISVLFGFYIAINFFFASLYYMIGIEFLDGVDYYGSTVNKFAKAFFFSTQTFTTVGYGHISPESFLTNALAATEALIGLLSFSIATGLFLGRSSKPTAHIQFSKNALISPFKNRKALMIRLVPYKNTHFTDAEAKVTLAIVSEENGQTINKFYSLPLEMNKIDSLNLSWTLVHEIDEQSPLYHFDADYFSKNQDQIMVFIKIFDDMFSTVVAAQTSYTFNEIVFNAKFEMMYHENTDQTITILELDNLNAFVRLATYFNTNKFETLILFEILYFTTLGISMSKSLALIAKFVSISMPFAVFFILAIVFISLVFPCSSNSPFKSNSFVTVDN
jgi:inward rectifier potassium channel